MKRIIFITIACLCVVFQAQSQETEQKQTSVKYSLVFESGFSAGWDYFGFEHTAVNSVRINDKHIIGLGIGLGTPIMANMYFPIYTNYRYYFKKGDFSPHVNVALGGVVFDKKGGLYSAVTTGFKLHNFSFSSGIFAQTYQYRHKGWGCFGYYDSIAYGFSWGFILKAGITF